MYTNTLKTHLRFRSAEDAKLGLEVFSNLFDYGEFELFSCADYRTEDNYLVIEEHWGDTRTQEQMLKVLKFVEIALLPRTQPE